MDLPFNFWQLEYSAILVVLGSLAWHLQHPMDVFTKVCGSYKGIRSSRIN